MGRKSWSKWLKVLVLTVGVADLLGFYLANRQLNLPIDRNPGDDNFVLAGLDPSASAQAASARVGRAALDNGLAIPAPAPGIKPSAVAISPQQLARIDLPLPAYGASSLAARSEPKVSVQPVARQNADLPRLASNERTATRRGGFSSAFADGVADSSPEQTADGQAGEPGPGLSAPVDTGYAAAAVEAPLAVSPSSEGDAGAPAEPATELPPVPSDPDSSLPAL